MSYSGFGQVIPVAQVSPVGPGGRGNSNDGSPTRGNSNDRSPTRTEVRSPTSTSTSTEVRSPTSTSTSTEVRSPTSTSTDAYTRGNVTVTGGAGAGANTTVTVYQGKPGDFPERKGRAAGRTQERIVRDSLVGLMAPRPVGVPIPLRADTVRQYGLMAPRPRGTPIPLQEGATTQKVGLTGIGSYSGLGSATGEQAPVQIGTLAGKDPILSTASVIASDIMLKMAAAPRSQRLAEMVRIMNRGQAGLGDAARANFMTRVAASAPDKVDQAMFDAIRGVLADALVQKTLALAKGSMSGLGQTLAEARGQTSQGVNDANALFCSYGAGIGAMVGGFATQFGSGGSTAGAGMTGATTAGSIAGCGAGQLVVQGEIAARNAQLSQSSTAQMLALQSAREATMMRYALIGGGGLITLVVLASILKK